MATKRDVTESLRRCRIAGRAAGLDTDQWAVFTADGGFTFTLTVKSDDGSFSTPYGHHTFLGTNNAAVVQSLDAMTDALWIVSQARPDTRRKSTGRTPSRDADAMIHHER